MISFSRNSSLNSSKNIRYLLKNRKSDYKYCLGLKVEATKSQAIINIALG